MAVPSATRPSASTPDPALREAVKLAMRGAASTVLAMFYGSDSIEFSTGSDFLPGVTRSFATFSAAAPEAAVSRLYGGIHFRSANEDGLSAGIAIGEWAVTYSMQLKKNRSRK